MDELNDLEHAILDVIIKANHTKYSKLARQLPCLKVKSREFTGVGAYVNFDLSQCSDDAFESSAGDGLLSADQHAQLDSLANGLGFVLDVTGGRLNYLELFTFGDEHWNGKYKFFEIVDN